MRAHSTPIHLHPKRCNAALGNDEWRLQLRSEFWTQVLEALNAKSAIAQNIGASTDAWIGTGVGLSGVSLNLAATRDYARVEIYLSRGEASKNKKAFDYLIAQREQIERALGAPLEWLRMLARELAPIRPPQLRVHDSEDAAISVIEAEVGEAVPWGLVVPLNRHLELHLGMITQVPPHALELRIYQ